MDVKATYIHLQRISALSVAVVSALLAALAPAQSYLVIPSLANLSDYYVRDDAEW